MRSLVKPRVLAQAGMAALGTSLACYPRLALWAERPFPVWFGCVILLWAGFVFWSFVLAWQPEYAHRPVISLKFPPKPWAFATVFGVIGAVMIHFLMDPQLRLTTPKDYPTNWTSWSAMTLFTLAFDPLFLCFAPFALFIRLTRKPDVSLALTVMFGIFVQYLKLSSMQHQPPPVLAVELVALHVIAGFASVYFYLKGGALLVWWVVFLGQSRHVYDLALSR